MVNAADGLQSLPPAAKAVAQFFRTNRRVWTDWLVRMRPPLVTVAWRLQSAAVSPAWLAALVLRRLQDLQNLILTTDAPAGPRVVRDLTRLVQRLAIALLALRDRDALEGAAAFVKELTRPPVQLISATDDSDSRMPPVTAAAASTSQATGQLRTASAAAAAGATGVVGVPTVASRPPPAGPSALPAPPASPAQAQATPPWAMYEAAGELLAGVLEALAPMAADSFEDALVRLWSLLADHTDLRPDDELANFIVQQVGRCARPFTLAS